MCIEDAIPDESLALPSVVGCADFLVKAEME
jgi:hypothetical protein